MGPHVPMPEAVSAAYSGGATNRLALGGALSFDSSDSYLLRTTSGLDWLNAHCLASVFPRYIFG